MELLSLGRGQLARLALPLVHLGLVDSESECRLREIQLPCDLGNAPPALEHQPDRFRLELTSERPPLPLRHEDTHIRLSQGVHEIGSIPQCSGRGLNGASPLICGWSPDREVPE